MDAPTLGRHHFTNPPILTMAPANEDAVPMVQMTENKASSSSAPVSSATPYVDVEAGAASNTLPPEPTIGQGFLKPIPETTPVERLAAGGAIAAVATAIVAMVVEQSAIVFIGGILSAVVGPYAYYQQTLLTDIRTLQETERAVRAEVDRLAAENQQLTATVQEMTASVQHLGDIEQALTVLTQTQGQSVDTFRKQVADNKEILAKMQTNLKANVLQNLLSVILRSDANQDLVVQDSEVNDLIRRIQQVSGVTVHEDRFRKAIAGNSVQAVMEVIKNLLREDVPPDQRIFEVPAQ